MAKKVDLSKRKAAVVGGGLTDMAVAIAGQRNGAKTVLVERLGFLGGNVTAAPMTGYSYWAVGDTQVVGGIALEMIKRMEAAGYAGPPSGSGTATVRTLPDAV